MKLSQIKVGKWYNTKVGFGPCLAAGGTFPPSVKIQIVGPVPRGVVNVIPRDVLKEYDSHDSQ